MNEEESFFYILLYIMLGQHAVKFLLWVIPELEISCLIFLICVVATLNE